jgi:hypothetical protein
VRASVGRERGQGGGGHAGRAVRVTACSAAGDRGQPPVQPVQHVAAGPSLGEPGEVIGHGGQAEHARPALLRALASQETQDARGFREAAAAACWRSAIARRTPSTWRSLQVQEHNVRVGPVQGLPAGDDVVHPVTAPRQRADKLGGNAEVILDNENAGVPGHRLADRHGGR